MVEKYLPSLSGNRRSIQANTDGLVIPYGQFRQLGLVGQLEIPQGTLVQRVPVGNLLTTRQNLDLDEEAVQRAAANFQGGRCIVPVQAHPRILPDQLGVGLVLDYGSYMAGIAIANGIKKVDVELQSPVLPRTETGLIHPLTELVRRHLGILKIRPGVVNCITNIRVLDSQEGKYIVQLNNNPHKSFPIRLLNKVAGCVYFVSQVGEKQVVDVARLAEGLINELPVIDKSDTL